MLRVLVLSTRFPDEARPNFGNSVERQTLELGRRPGVEVEVVAPVAMPPFPWSRRRRHDALRSLPESEEWKGLKVRRPRFVALPYPRRSAPVALARRLLPLLSELHQRFAFDVISAEYFWPDGPAVMRLAQRLGVPWSLKARGMEFEAAIARPSTRMPALAAGRAATGLLAVSAALREAMIGAGLPAERIAVHYPGIDRTLFRPLDGAAARRALRVEGPVLLAVGNLIPAKGHCLAVEALERLEGATLLIAGAGPERARIEAQVRRLGLDGRVRMLGSVPHALLPALFAAADVTVHPSLVEGVANVRIESLACGTPVVTTAVGGADEAIDRPEAGRIVAAEPSAIAAGVSEMLASPPPPERVAEAADRFSWERNASELEAHLRRLAGRRGQLLSAAPCPNGAPGA